MISPRPLYCGGRVYGHGPLAELTAAWSYYLADGNRTVRQLSTAAGDITVARSYTPWGK